MFKEGKKFIVSAQRGVLKSLHEALASYMAVCSAEAQIYAHICIFECICMYNKHLKEG